jgi:hypothetical protein
MNDKKNNAHSYAMLFSCVFTVFVLLCVTALRFTPEAAARRAPSPTVPELLTESSTQSAVPLRPGDLFQRDAGVKNAGDRPFFVRVRVIPVVTAADGLTRLPASIGVSAGSTIRMEDPNNTHWRAGSDGYYYYLDQLNPGQSTGAEGLGRSLFSRLRLRGDLPAAYNNCTVEIALYCENADIRRWNYRNVWWGGVVPEDASLQGVDAVLALKTG